MQTSELVKRINEAGPLTRTAVILRDSGINEKDRTVNVAFSSEEPYLRYFGNEILGHSAGEVDMSFMGSGRAPFLDGHDSRKQIGVIEKAWIDGDRKGRATVRFSKNPAAQEVFQDIIDGIRTNISVGYEVKSMVLVKENAEEGNSYRVDSWMPLEASIVSIPADRTVGVGREHKNQPEKENYKMKPDNKIDPSEQNRINEILALGDHPSGNFKDAARQALTDGTSIHDFRAFVLDELKKKKDESPVNLDPRLFSSGGRREEETPLMDCIRAQIPEFQNDRGAGRAREIHQQIARERGLASKGILVPLGERQQRSLVTNVGSQGGYMVQEVQGQIIEQLHNASLCLAAGVKALPGLSGDVAFPKINTGVTAYWIGEEGEATESELGLGQLRMTPKTVAAHVVISRRLMLQTSGIAEQVVKENIAQQLGVALDAAILNGSGSAHQPRGILQVSGIGSVTLNAANIPTWANIVGLETAISIDNALNGRLAYMTGSAIAGNMKTTDKASGAAKFLLEDGKSNGHPVFVSNNVPAKHIIFGNWADAMLGMWSGLDVLVDPYSGAKKGEIAITAFLDVDVAVRHAESFADGYKA